MTYSIYIVNGPGVCYVGCTSVPVHERWLGHLACARRGSALPLHVAIRQHGHESFAVRTVAMARGQFDARATESAVALQALSEGAPLCNYLSRLSTGGLVPERRVEMWTRRLLGESVDALAREYGFAPSTIRAECGFWPLFANARSGRSCVAEARALGADEVRRRVRHVLERRSGLVLQ